MCRPRLSGVDIVTWGKVIVPCESQQRLREHGLRLLPTLLAVLDRAKEISEQEGRGGNDCAGRNGSRERAEQNTEQTISAIIRLCAHPSASTPQSDSVESCSAAIRLVRLRSSDWQLRAFTASWAAKARL
jgi:hypothetical protein